jgi:hypothetical protein
VKLALTLIGKHVDSPLGEQDALQRANELLKAQARIVIRDADGKIIRRAPAGLRAALAVVHLLGLGVTQARATIQETVSGLNVGKDKRDPTMRLEEIHVALVNNLISLQDTSARADRSILEAMIHRLDEHKSELRAVRVYEETEYTVPILARIAQSPQAEAYELLGNTSEATRQRQNALTPGRNFKPLLVSQDETFTPLGMLLGGWIFLEIYNAGFCQWLDDDYRNYAGPRFLELELDPTTSLWDYAFWSHPERWRNNSEVDASQIDPGRKLSIAEAARAISVTRGTLKGYISTGRVHKNSDGTIDTGELQRAGFIIRNWSLIHNAAAPSEW